MQFLTFHMVMRHGLEAAMIIVQIISYINLLVLVNSNRFLSAQCTSTYTLTSFLSNIGPTGIQAP